MERRNFLKLAAAIPSIALLIQAQPVAANVLPPAVVEADTEKYWDVAAMHGNVFLRTVNEAKPAVSLITITRGMGNNVGTLTMYGATGSVEVETGNSLDGPFMNVIRKMINPIIDEIKALGSDTAATLSVSPYRERWAEVIRFTGLTPNN